MMNCYFFAVRPSYSSLIELFNSISCKLSGRFSEAFPTWTGPTLCFLWMFTWNMLHLQQLRMLQGFTFLGTGWRRPLSLSAKTFAAQGRSFFSGIALALNWLLCWLPPELASLGSWKLLPGGELAEFWHTMTPFSILCLISIFLCYSLCGATGLPLTIFRMLYWAMDFWGF